MRATKIIATLGPAVESKEMLVRIIKAGCDIARFNVAHGDVESHLKLYNQFTEVARELGVNVSTMLDIKGPELRVLETRMNYLKDGAVLNIGPGKDIEFNHDIYASLSVGDKILIHDGDIILNVVKSGDNVSAEVVRGGRISIHMGVNVPGVSLSIPYIQERDIEFMRNLRNVDFIAASFTRSAKDICALRKEMRRIGMHAEIIAKIENKEGVENIDEILELADGIMVARGDLGTEIPVEELPGVQKYLLMKAREHGKPGIVATQILESMMHVPYPTRAEVSDIANAILDGGDALMLSGETAVGKYPVEAISLLARVAEHADKLLCKEQTFLDLKGTISESVSNAAILLASEVHADGILILTRTGKTARLISRHRPGMNILAATYDERVLRQLNIYWGVSGFIIERNEHTDIAVKNAINTAEKLGLVKKGNTLVVVGGESTETRGITNFIWVQIVGEVVARGTGYGEKIICGKICRFPGKCDIVVFEGISNEIETGGARAIIIESRIYDPELLKRVAASGVVVLAGTGPVGIKEKTVTVDPQRGILYS